MLILTGARPGLDRGIDPVEDARDREVDPVHRAEDGVVERIEADRHPLQAGFLERRRQRPERGPVRGQGQVDLAPVRPADGRQHRDQVGQVTPDERLATRDPELVDAERHEDPGDPLDLLEAQDLVLRQERVVPPEDLLGHAIGAPEIAPIGHRDPQVAHGPAERVGRPGAGIAGSRGIHQGHGSPERRERPTVPPARTNWYH